MGWTTHYPEKMKVVTNYVTKPQYSNKQASISFLENRGPQILATSILMTLLDCLGHVCELRYLKPTIFAFFGSLKLA